MEIGELRQNLARDMKNMLELILNRMSKHPAIYWILIHSDWDNLEKPTLNTPMPWRNSLGPMIRPHKTDVIVAPENVLRTNFVLIPTKPTHPLVSTACVEVNNKQGRVTWLWVLPKDAPRPLVEQEKDSENETVFESAKQSGAIVYG